MRTLSTHVLDAVLGRPAVGVGVRLALRSEAPVPAGWREIGVAVTDADGRVADLAPGGVDAGTYRIVFDTGGYYRATSQVGFYPEVSVCFLVADDRHYHVPLLLSPYAFSTYRGS